jgi:phage terminase small subunit
LVDLNATQAAIRAGYCASGDARHDELRYGIERCDLTK